MVLTYRLRQSLKMLTNLTIIRILRLPTHHHLALVAVVAAVVRTLIIRHYLRQDVTEKAAAQWWLAP